MNKIIISIVLTFFVSTSAFAGPDGKRLSYVNTSNYTNLDYVNYSKKKENCKYIRTDRIPKNKFCM